MVYVPAGDFLMGSTDADDGADGDEKPQHTVYLDAFWMDQTEVTVAMFRTFVEDTGYETTAERQGWGKPWTDGPQELEWPHVNGADWQHPRGPGSIALDRNRGIGVLWEMGAQTM